MPKTSPTTAPTEKQKRRAVTDDDRIKWAIARHTRDPVRGRFPTVAEIADDDDVRRDSSVVSRGIQAAFENRLVVIQRVAPLQQPARDESLENALKERFPKLRKAIVVRTTAGGQHPDDDAVHELLGTAMAHDLHASATVRDHEVIGIGSGRGVFYLATALQKLPELRIEEVSLVSLSGRVYPKAHKRWVNVPMDADNHLVLLGLCFEGKLTLVPIFRDIVHRGQGTLEEALKNTPLESHIWASRTPTQAFIGVGVLSTGHRFYNEIQLPPEERSEVLRPIVADLDALVKLADRITNAAKHAYYPVGDICHTLFFIPPPVGLSISPQEERQLKDYITKLNNRLINVKLEQLKQIRLVSLIAGTPQKAGAIHALLRTDSAFDIRVQVICTDDRTAAAIHALASNGR